jgi:proton-translocating NADH-quinone oxidoreductase chain M
MMAFLSMDFLLFYICFEIILVPFFVLMGISSFKKRRIHASMMFVFFTLFGSFLMLFGIFEIYSMFHSLNVECISNYIWGDLREYVVWILLFISFCVKIPMFPFHIWLPEAHVESPTEGSVLLAGVLLKLGSYGILRFLMSIFPGISYYYSPIVLMLSSISIFYTSLVTLRQIDVKRVIAYSSIVHMNAGLLGLFGFNSISIVGSIQLMVAHGMVSSGMFFIAGFLYSRYHTKIIHYYGGIGYTMPLFSAFFFIFILGNIGFPLLSNFVGESLLIIGIISILNKESVFFFSFGVFVSSVYCLWLYNRVVFVLPKLSFFKKGFDLVKIELFIIIILLWFVIWMGIRPIIWLHLLESSTFYYFYSFANFM